MKNTIFILIIAVGLPQLSAAQVTSYSVGDDVDTVQVYDMFANYHDLRAVTQSGKYILINVFDVDGPSSQNSFEAFNLLYEKYGCNSGDIYCLSVNNGTDDDGTVADFITNYGGSSAQAPVVTGTEGLKVKNHFGIIGFPTFFLIGSDNKLKKEDIWPVASVSDIEAGFPVGFEPTPMNCTSEIEEPEDFLVQIPYPNPAKNELNIELNSNLSELTIIKLYNNLGQEVKSITARQQTLVKLGLNDISSGIYHLKLTSNQQSVTYRIEVID